MKMKILTIFGGLLLLPLFANADLPGKHPAYLHALTDLRTARWMLEHRPGDAAVSGNEDAAITEIDAAIREIALIVECAGITEIARHLELGREANAVAVVEYRHEGAGAGRDCLGQFFGSRIVWTRAINAQADAGLNGLAVVGSRLDSLVGSVFCFNAVGCGAFCFDAFRFNIYRLFYFVEAAQLKMSVTCDMGSDLEFLAVGVGLNAGVEARGSSAELNVKRACKKERRKGDRPTQSGATKGEIRGGSDECGSSDYPPKGGAPLVDPGDNASRVCGGGPQHGLARGFKGEGAGGSERSGWRTHTARRAAPSGRPPSTSSGQAWAAVPT